jgi:hypothetical protein
MDAVKRALVTRYQVGRPPKNEPKGGRLGALVDIFKSVGQKVTIGSLREQLKRADQNSEAVCAPRNKAGKTVGR